MKIPSQETLEKLRSEYPAGTRVELIEMDDCQAPSVGTRGTVLGVDAIGNLLMSWDNGCGLNAVPGVDKLKILFQSTRSETERDSFKYA